MGRANYRGGGGGTHHNSSSSSSSSQSSSIYDPSHIVNLRRSLSRNDVELSALSKLHKSMSSLRNAIVDEYGDEALVESAIAWGKERWTKSSSSSSSLSSSPSYDDERLDKLSSALFLRVELRKRLLNRLARRLHRVAYAMDGGGGGASSSNSCVAPLPPLYGDVVRRYVTTESLESGLASKILGGTIEDVKIVSEGDVSKYMDGEEEGGKIREELDGRRLGREGGGEVRRGGRGSLLMGGNDMTGRRGGRRTTATTDENEDDEKDVEMMESEEGAKDGEDENVEEEDDDDGSEESVSDDFGSVPGKGGEAGGSPSDAANAILRADEEDMPLLDRLASYDPGYGYDKTYHIASDPGPRAGIDSDVAVEGGRVDVTVPIASTIDDHEVNDEGEFLANKNKEGGMPPTAMQRLPFSLHGSTNTHMARALLPKERAAEWKRWTREICERIPDQVTFEDLGVGGPGMVFDLEGRLKKNNNGHNKRKGLAGGDEDEEKGRIEEDASSASDRGKGIVPRKDAGLRDDANDVSDGDVAMGKPEDETKTRTEDAMEVVDAKKVADDKKDHGVTTTKIFSITPVPSFYYQDLKRIQNIQSEMVRSLHVQQSRERVITAQVEYDAAYKRSMDIQQAKTAAVQEYHALPEMFKSHEAKILNEKTMLLADAKRHWEKRQHQLKVMEQTFGKEQALNRSVCNDVLQDLKDRVCIRSSGGLEGSGLGTARLSAAARKARSVGDDDKDVSATVLGYMIDSVERRHNDMLQNYVEFVPPSLTLENVIANSETGETMAQRRARIEREMRAKISRLDAAFKDAEKKRGETWLNLTKVKGGGGSSSGQSASTGGSIASKPKPRSRKSVPSGGGPYPMQAQTQPGPGYVPASYYQQQRPPGAATQMQAQMVAPAASQMMMQHAHIARMQTMMVQQQQQYQAQAVFPVQSLPIQMNPSQFPQHDGILSAVPSLNSVITDPSFVPSAPSIIAPNIANEGVIGQEIPSHPFDINQQHHSEAKQAKYGYGDKYSQTNVNARKNSDGTVVPVSTPKLLPDGTYARPAGRQRKGMDWDAIKGCWFPMPGGGDGSNG